MRTLTIEVSYFKNQKHEIHIGDCEWLHIKGKRFVRDYIVRYKKMLLSNVRVINSLYRLSFDLYRDNYFQLSDGLIRELDREFVSSLTDFNMIFKRYSSGNNNAFVLRRISVCYNNTSRVLLLLKGHGQRNKNYALIGQVTTYLKMLDDSNRNFELDKRDLRLVNEPKESKLKIVHNSMNSAS